MVDFRYYEKEAKGHINNLKRFKENGDLKNAYKEACKARDKLYKAIELADDPENRKRLGDYYKNISDASDGYLEEITKKTPLDKINEDEITDEFVESLLLSPEGNKTFDNIFGLENASNKIKNRLINPLKEGKDPYLGKGGGIYVYGPSGTGKTLLIRATANEVNNISEISDIPVYLLDSRVFSKWFGVTENRIHKIFDYLEKHYKIAIVGMDEFDAMGSSGDATSTAVMYRIHRLLQQKMDGVAKKDKKIYFIAATNVPWSSDPQFLRRFHAKIKVKPPDHNAKINILKQELEDRKEEIPFDGNIDFDGIIKMLEEQEENGHGVWMGGDISNLVENAYECCLDNHYGEKKEKLEIIYKHFEDALKMVIPVNSRAEIEKFDHFEKGGIVSTGGNGGINIEKIDKEISEKIEKRVKEALEDRIKEHSKENTAKNVIGNPAIIERVEEISKVTGTLAEKYNNLLAKADELEKNYEYIQKSIDKKPKISEDVSAPDDEEADEFNEFIKDKKNIKRMIKLLNRNIERSIPTAVQREVDDYLPTTVPQYIEEYLKNIQKEHPNM